MTVWALAPQGMAARAGLRSGDNVLGINGRVPDLPHLLLGLVARWS